jgi:hypothetical protein
MLAKVMAPAWPAAASARALRRAHIVTQAVLDVGTVFGLQMRISLIESCTPNFENRGRGCRRIQIGDVNVRMSNNVTAVKDDRYATLTL